MLKSILKLIIYGIVGAALLLVVGVIALLNYTPGSTYSEPASASSSASSSSSGGSLPRSFAVSNVNPDWPGAAFPSDAWKTSELEWYVQWKRVRKYARIAFQTSQFVGLSPLSDQARELYAHVAGWDEGRQKAACLPAAEELHKALLALVSGEPSGFAALQASEAAGDRCRAAAQAALRRR